MSAPVEHKVTAGTAGAGAGGVIASAALWALGRYAFHGAVPGQVDALVELAVPAALAAAGGWLAPHTARPTPPGVPADTAAPQLPESEGGYIAGATP